MNINAPRPERPYPSLQLCMTVSFSLDDFWLMVARNDVLSCISESTYWLIRVYTLYRLCITFSISYSRHICYLHIYLYVFVLLLLYVICCGVGEIIKLNKFKSLVWLIQNCPAFIINSLHILCRVFDVVLRQHPCKFQSIILHHKVTDFRDTIYIVFAPL